ncbi:MAG: alpha/beta fold hydrolase [Gemmatimonadaceae bacterium]|nr:alpha/beta fold hydrolase [Gemmatimonadaceae bacterium]
MRLLPCFLLASALTAQTPAVSGSSSEGDFITRDFRLDSGERLAELRIHYTAFGRPVRGADGKTTNAVLVLHGTGGSGRGFLSAGFAGELFGPGKLLDTARYYVVLPDGIGHGKSSKPSDGMRARFPHYNYNDMVRAQRLLLTDGLGVSRLRLIIGTSMGCMHAWVWGTTFPEFTDGLVPLACAPTAIVGRNRMIRTMVIDDIRQDPEYADGNYTAQPRGFRAANQLLYMMSSAPLVQHRVGATRAAADSVIRSYLDARVANNDANDMLYAFDASRDYDPSAQLARVQVPVLAINSADDLVNPPELGLVERLTKGMPNVRFILLPITEQTRGHGTHSVPAVWGGYLAEFMKSLPAR